MKIAILADPLDNQRAGVHVYVRELVRALIANPGPHEYLLIREKVDPELPIEQHAIANVHLPIGYASIRLFLLVPRLLRRLKVDAVFEPAHFGPFNLPRHVKRITMIHDLTPILLPHFHRWHSQVLQRVFLRRILEKADLVVSNSHNTTADLARIYPCTIDKTATIHLGLGEGFFPDAGTEFLEQFSIDRPYFIYVGTIEPRKNLLLLLDAFEQFRRTSPEKTLLVIVGQRGWKSEPFFARLVEHPFRNDIKLTGFVDQHLLPQAYFHSLALVYPSVYEGFGLPVLEAMACGTNVVCPDNSSLPEVGGKLAVYYATHDHDALAQHLASVRANAAEIRERRSSVTHWAASFSWDKYSKEFNALLENC